MMTQRPSLLKTDQELLQLLRENPRQTPAMLLKEVESTGSKQYIQNRLKHLREHDFANRPERGIYELTAFGEQAADALDQYHTDRNNFWSHVDSDS